MAFFQSSFERFQQMRSMGAARKKKHWLEERTLSLRIEKHNGELRIYEYINGNKRSQLQYPQPNGRDYYRTGDIVLVKTTSRRQLSRIFPELEYPEEGIMAYLDMLMYFIADEPPASYQYAYKIENIRLSFSGRGEVKWRGLLLLPEAAVELQSNGEISLQELNIRFILSAHDKGLAFAEDKAFTLCNTTAKILPYGIFKRGPLVLAKQLNRRFLKKNLFRKLKNEIKNILLKSLVAAVTAALSELARQMQLNRLRRQASNSEIEAALIKIAAAATEKGISVLFSALFQKAVTSWLGKMMEAYDEVTGGAEQSFMASLRRYLYQQIYHIITVDLYKSITRLYLKVIRETLTEGEAQSQLTELLSASFISLMTGKINQALDDSFEQNQLNYFKNQR